MNSESFRTLPVPKLVINNAVPAILSMIIVLVYNMADTFFIGQTGDEIQVAAVSLATPVFLLFMSIGELFGIGGTSVIARALGEGDKETAKKASSFCFWASIASGIFFIVVFYLFINNILTLIGASTHTWNYARTYLLYVSWSAPFVILSTSLSNIVRTEGMAKQAMIGIMSGTILNIILDPLFILGAGMGIAGAAWATVIGNIVSTAYFIILLMPARHKTQKPKTNNLLHGAKRETVLSMRLSDFTLKKSIVYAVISIGVPGALNSIMMSVSNIILNIYMVSYGDVALAATGVAMKITMITALLQLGLGQGIQPLLGYCYGAKLQERFKHIMRYSNKFSIIMGIILTLLCLVFSRWLVNAFIDSAEVGKFGARFVHILLISGPIIGTSFVYASALRAVGAAKESLILSISRQGIIFIPCLIILNSIFKLNGLLYAQPVADLLSCVLAFVLYRWRMRNYGGRSAR